MDFKAAITIQTTRERLESGSNELEGKIFLRRNTVLTFTTVPKEVFTGAIKVRTRVVCEEAEGQDSQEQRFRYNSRNPSGTYCEEQSLRGERFWALIWVKLLLRIHPFH